VCEKNFAAALSEPIVSETPTEGQLAFLTFFWRQLSYDALSRPFQLCLFPLSFILVYEFRRAVIFVDFFKAQQQELSRIHASQVEMSFSIRSAKLIRVRPPKRCRIEFVFGN
jgi:hypothetical protein